MPATENKVCQICGSTVNVCFVTDNNVGYICMECIPKYNICEKCFTLVKREDSFMITDETGVKYWYCNNCKNTVTTFTCKYCNRETLSSAKDMQGNSICFNCINEEDMIQCSHCNKYFDSALGCEELNYVQYPNILHSSKAYCPSCFKALTKNKIPLKVDRCIICQCITSNTFTKHKQTVFVCKEHTHKLAWCQHCNSIQNKSKFVDTVDGLLCNSCAHSYQACAYCGYKYHKHSLHTNNYNGQTICANCLENRKECSICHNYYTELSYNKLMKIYTCDNCKQYITTCTGCNKPFIRTDNYNQCHTCLQKTVSLSASINNYSFVPQLFFNKLPHETTKVFYGFENEMQNITNNYNETTFNFIPKNFKQTELYLKSDSSIDHGVEIVSHPFTFKAFQAVDWSKLFTRKTSRHRSCGMHVHISKNAFTRLHLFKVIRFIYDYPDFLTFIAERASNHYCHKLDKNTMVRNAKNYKERVGEKYDQVNIQKRNTVEFRFFANANKEETLRKNIEFLDALYYFTKLKGLRSTERLSEFIKYVEYNQEVYPNLYMFMKKWKESK